MMDTAPNYADSGNDTFARALQRVRAEFNEMPGMSLTVHQAARLWALDLASCAAVLTALEDARFLVRIRHEVFARAE